MSCSGYSRSDFIVSEKGLIFLETNTLPGLTKASLYPKSLKAQGIEFADFLQGPDRTGGKTRAEVVLARSPGPFFLRSAAGREVRRRLGADLTRCQGRAGRRDRDHSSVKLYNFRANHSEGGSNHIPPAPDLPFVYQEVRRLTLAAHVALGCRGVSRADFRFDDRIEGTGGLFCLEADPQPGITETSSVPELAAFAGTTFDELVQWMVEDASLDR